MWHVIHDVKREYDGGYDWSIWVRRSSKCKHEHTLCYFQVLEILSFIIFYPLVHFRICCKRNYSCFCSVPLTSWKTSYTVWGGHTDYGHAVLVVIKITNYYIFVFLCSAVIALEFCVPFGVTFHPQVPYKTGNNKWVKKCSKQLCFIDERWQLLKNMLKKNTWQPKIKRQH